MLTLAESRTPYSKNKTQLNIKEPNSENLYVSCGEVGGGIGGATCLCITGWSVSFLMELIYIIISPQYVTSRSEPRTSRITVVTYRGSGCNSDRAKCWEGHVSLHPCLARLKWWAAEFVIGNLLLFLRYQIRIPNLNRPRCYMIFLSPFMQQSRLAQR